MVPHAGEAEVVIPGRVRLRRLLGQGQLKQVGSVSSRPNLDPVQGEYNNVSKTVTDEEF